MIFTENRVAAAYIRVSTEEQAEYSPSSQLKKIMEYAEKNKITVPEELVFTDEGISGKSTKPRREFNRMIAVAKEKPRRFDTILVWKFSRFSRNREDSIVYKSMLRRELGIRVISVSEDVGDDKMSVIFESMIEAMDEYYSINLAEEVKRGMAERIRSGKVCAAAPFGYKTDNKRLAVVPEEAEIIRYVFEAFSDGKSMVSLAQDLNDMGILTHRGGKIENRTIEYWLNNPVYIGKVRWNPKGKTERFHWDDEDIIIADGEHEPIVSNELWKRAGNRLKREKKLMRRVYEQKKPTGFLVGILKCGVCGGAMVNCGGYFYCLNKTKGACRGNGGVKAEKLEKEMAEIVKNAACCGKIEISVSDTQRGENAQLERAEKRLVRIQKAYEEGVDTIDEYKEKKENVLRQIDAIKNTERKKSAPDMCEKSIYEILTSEKCGNAQKSTAIRSVISRIVKIGESEYDIFLNFRCPVDLTEN